MFCWANDRLICEQCYLVLIYKLLLFAGSFRFLTFTSLLLLLDSHGTTFRIVGFFILQNNSERRRGKLLPSSPQSFCCKYAVYGLDVSLDFLSASVSSILGTRYPRRALTIRSGLETSTVIERYLPSRCSLLETYVNVY